MSPDCHSGLSHSTWCGRTTESALARGSPRSHPPLLQPTRLRRAALRAPKEQPRRVNADERLLCKACTPPRECRREAALYGLRCGACPTSASKSPMSCPRSMQVQPHGHASTGEWAQTPSPVLIGHAVSTRAARSPTHPTACPLYCTHPAACRGLACPACPLYCTHPAACRGLACPLCTTRAGGHARKVLSIARVGLVGVRCGVTFPRRRAALSMTAATKYSGWGGRGHWRGGGQGGQ